MTSEYRKGAFASLLHLRNWMDSHSASLASAYGCRKRGDGVETFKMSPILNEKANRNVRKLIGLFIDNIDDFMRYGSQFEVCNTYDDDNKFLDFRVYTHKST